MEIERIIKQRYSGVEFWYFDEIYFGEKISDIIELVKRIANEPGYTFSQYLFDYIYNIGQKYPFLNSQEVFFSMLDYHVDKTKLKEPLSPINL